MRPLTFKSRGEDGITMIEMAMVIALLGILAFVAPSLFRQFQFFMVGDRAQAELQVETITGMDTLIQFIHQGSGHTAKISSPSAAHPWSNLEFDATDSQKNLVHYTIAQSDEGRSVTMTTQKIQPLGAAQTQDLFRQVAFISFAFSRTDDPLILRVVVQQQSDGTNPRRATFTRTSEIRMQP